MVFLAFVHLALFLALFVSLGNSDVSSWYDHSMLASLLFQCLTVPSFTPALLRTHSFVFFAVHETRRIFLSPFVSKASRRVSQRNPLKLIPKATQPTILPTRTQPNPPTYVIYNKRKPFVDILKFMPQYETKHASLSLIKINITRKPPVEAALVVTYLQFSIQICFRTSASPSPTLLRSPLPTHLWF